MSIGSQFVSEMDSYIRENINLLTCSDTADIYFDLLKSLMRLGGNPDNVTGLTEFIIFRMLYWLNEEKITAGEIRLESKGKIGFRSPDIIIYNSCDPVYSIQIKSNYYKVKEDYDRHMEVIEVKPTINIATIAFEVRDPNHVKHIEKLRI